MFFEVATNPKLGIKFLEKEIRLVPQFAAVLDHPSLGMKGFQFVVSVCDHMSPYRNLPDEMRITKVAEAVFKQKAKVEALDSEIIKRAMDEYEEIQNAADADWNNYFAIEGQCMQISKFLRDTTPDVETMEAIEKAAKTLKALSDMKKFLKETLFSKVEKPEDSMAIRAGKKLSLAEKKFLNTVTDGEEGSDN